MKETIDKKRVTEEQIAAWVDEAEKGYDVNVLKKRGRGRPGRGAAPSQVIAVRLTPEELKQIDQKAAELNMTRSEYIRHSLTA
ncbi:MAG: plasmid mobilization protein [Saccharofermentanales bacterium]